MITKDLVNFVFDNASIDNVVAYAREVINGMFYNVYYNDEMLIYNLELLSGAKSPLKEEDLSKEKIEDYVKKYAYKADDATNITIDFIDNIQCIVRCKYDIVKDGDTNTYRTEIPLSEVKVS